MRRRSFLGAVFVALLSLPAPAGAFDVDGPSFRRLAQEAITDPAALDRLREVDTVDGRPVNVELLIADASPDERRRRLRALSEGQPTGSLDREAARADARRILAEDRFQPSELPRPLRGPLERLGSWLRSIVTRAIGLMPGGAVVFWTIVVLVVGIGAAAISTWIARRRTADVARHEASIQREARPDPRALEREAAQRERAGDLAGAMRLLFRAGLLRLDALGVITYRPSMTTGEIARRVRTRAFNRLARAFEEVVYGGRPATPKDIEGSRAAWKRTLAEVRR